MSNISIDDPDSPPAEKPDSLVTEPEKMPEEERIAWSN
jgi:hypothetical protein